MANEKDKGIVDLSKDDEYAARIAAAKSGRVPVGGVPMPPMPRFDQAPPDRTQPVQAIPGSRPVPGGPVLSPQQQQEMAAQGNFIPGVGSAYSANQPAIARGTPVKQQPPQQPSSTEFANPPRGENAGLRPETVQQLEAVAKANASGAPADKKADDDLNKTVEQMTEDYNDSFDYDNFGRRVRSMLNNKERREAIEKRCESMDIADLIVQGEVRQVVPIVPNKFFPTFRSVAGTEDLFIKKLMSDERGSDQYILDKFAIMNLAAGLYALNGKPLPSHLDDKGDPDEKLFQHKFKVVLKMALPILADLSTNYTWFGSRLEKLFIVDNIKGF